MPVEGRHARAWIARGFAYVEDFVYLGLGLLLAACLAGLLASSFVDFGRMLASGAASSSFIGILDEVLLLLLFTELLYTVQVSFREHVLAAEPFLLVGMISAIRRVLVVTAELGEKKTRVDPTKVAELGVLALLVLALAVSLLILRRRKEQATAER